MSDDYLARVTLNQLTEPGDAGVGQLVDAYGAAEVVNLIVDKGPAGGVWSDDMGARIEGLIPAEDLLVRAERDGIRFITPTHPEWPHQIADLGKSQPIGLWAKGDLNLAETVPTAVAIVGSRAATMYGTAQAHAMAEGFATQGRAVVSGAAFGIDQAAHRGALAGGGQTIAVMPCGVDRSYPTAHAQLVESIAAQGLVVSELPPGAAPTRHRFLIRTSGLRLPCGRQSSVHAFAHSSGGLGSGCEVRVDVVEQVGAACRGVLQRGGEGEGVVAVQDQSFAGVELDNDLVAEPLDRHAHVSGGVRPH